MSSIDVSERSFEPLVLHRSSVMPVVVVLAKVDIDLCPALWRRYEVRTVPAVKAFRDGEVVAELTGIRSPQTVERFFDELVAAHARA